jgi:hypothetical protein
MRPGMVSSRMRRVQPRVQTAAVRGASGEDLWGGVDADGWGRYTQLRELVLEIDDDRACLGRLVLRLPYRLQGSPHSPTLCAKAKAKASRRKPARCHGGTAPLPSSVSERSIQAINREHCDVAGTHVLVRAAVI